MLFNTVLGFLVPWSFGIYLYTKAPKVVLLISPIAVIISMIINDIGFHLKFWDFTPHIPDDDTISALPLDLGLYPVLSSWMIFWIRRTSLHWTVIALIVSLFTTGLEFFGLFIGKVSYGNGWNIGYTAVSYTIAYIGVYGYYMILLKYGLLSRKRAFYSS